MISWNWKVYQKDYADGWVEVIDTRDIFRAMTEYSRLHDEGFAGKIVSSRVEEA